MVKKNLLVLLVIGFALAALTASTVKADHDTFGHIVLVEIDGVDASSVDFAEFSGSKIPVLIVFQASDGLDDDISNEVVAEEARIKVWFSGERENAVVTDRFDVLEGKTYTRFLLLEVPSDLNRELDETRILEIVVESRSEGIADHKAIDFTVQRESFDIEILGINMHSEVKAGEALIADVVIKNTGRQFAEDNFLRVAIPELGLETNTYFGDLSALDESHPDKEDAVERRAFLRIPSDVPAGFYTVVFEVFNSDSFASREKNVLIVGASEDTMIVSGTASKTFSVGEVQQYALTIVNRGSTIRIYELFLDASGSLNVEIEPVVVVPAGSSRTVDISAEASESGQSTFTVNVLSDGKLIDAKTFSANVREDGGRSTDTRNATVLLTIVLAIVFIVLLVVLIVLLTRKPEKAEEFGESYY